MADIPWSKGETEQVEQPKHEANPEAEPFHMHRGVREWLGIGLIPKMVWYRLWNLNGCRIGMVTSSTADIARYLGIGQGSVRGHLKTLQDAGLVDRFEWHAKKGRFHAELIVPSEDPARPRYSIVASDRQPALFERDERPGLAVVADDAEDGAQEVAQELAQEVAQELAPPPAGGGQSGGHDEGQAEHSAQEDAQEDAQEPARGGAHVSVKDHERKIRDPCDRVPCSMDMATRLANPDRIQRPWQRPPDGDGVSDNELVEAVIGGHSQFVKRMLEEAVALEWVRDTPDSRDRFLAIFHHCARSKGIYNRMGTLVARVKGTEKRGPLSLEGIRQEHLDWADRFVQRNYAHEASDTTPDGQSDRQPAGVDRRALVEAIGKGAIQ